MRTEFQARGFAYLTATRCNTFLNEAYHALCEWNGVQWPFLEATTTGTAPLTISDLREVLYVVDTTTQDRLEQADSRDIVDLDPLVTTSGTAQRYWLDGLTTLKVWPTDTGGSLSVRYIKVPADLANDSDTPVIPSRYHGLIVDMAEVFGMQERSDYSEAEQKMQLFAQRAEAMRVTLTERAGDDPDFIVVTRNDDQGSWWAA